MCNTKKSLREYELRSVYAATILNGTVEIVCSKDVTHHYTSLHAEIVMLHKLKHLKNLPKKLKIYVFRISKTKNLQSKFFGSLGSMKNVWFMPAHMCWACYRSIRDSFAFNLKWLTPSESGWSDAILEQPKPSVGTLIFWSKKGIPPKEYEDIIKNGDASMLDRLKITIRQI